MPPRGRSSSSRSRSSSSRSRSSSSRSRSSSSSRSRSSSSRSRSSSSSRSTSSISRSSGPSSRSVRSSTSHSSSYSPSYGSSYGNSYGTSRPTTRRVQKTRSKTDRKAIIFARNYKKPIRTKPTFVLNNTKVTPTFHHCYKHDYYYYSTDFYDETTNVHYKKGYYDENGEYYENLDLKYSENEIIEIVKCEYCGSSEKIDLINAEVGQTFKCSNCSALLNLDNITELNTDYYVCDEKDNFPNEQIETYYEDEPYNPYQNGNNNNYYSTNSTSSTNGIGLITGFVCFLLLICCFPCFLGTLDNSSFDNDYSYDEDYYDYDYDNSYYEDDYNTSYEDFYDYEIFGDNLYVPEIDRTCYFDGDYYYDSVSDCYFYYNTDVSPAQMTYWYEDFSSQYGDDYGWIEYDENDGNWYVEVDYGEWEVVDNPPSYFWYTSFDSLLTGNNITLNDSNYDENNYEYNYDDVELGSTIYISEIDRYCSLDDEFYYDSETDCYFYIDYDNDVPIVLYWYEDFSSQYDNDYGWLDYDERDENWYVEVDYEEWEIVDNPPSYFWHTSYESICKNNNTLNYNDIIEETNAGSWNGDF